MLPFSHTLARKLGGKQGFRVLSDGEEVDLMAESPPATIAPETFRLEKLFRPVSYEDARRALEETCRESLIEFELLSKREPDLNEPGVATVSLKYRSNPARKAVLLVAANRDFISFTLLPQ